MRIVVKLSALALLVFANVIGAQTKQEAPKFSLAIRTIKPEVTLGTDVDISIVISNISQQALSLGFGTKGNVASGYRYDVRDEQGAPAAKIDAVRYTVTPSGERLRLPSRPPGSYVQGSLRPGEGIGENAKVSDIYTFDQPGKYTIRVSRKEPNMPMVYSNIVTVTVLPAATPPAQQ